LRTPQSIQTLKNTLYELQNMQQDVEDKLEELVESVTTFREDNARQYADGFLFDNIERALVQLNAKDFSKKIDDFESEIEDLSYNMKRSQKAHDSMVYKKKFTKDRIIFNE